MLLITFFPCMRPPCPYSQHPAVTGKFTEPISSFTMRLPLCWIMLDACFNQNAITLLSNAIWTCHMLCYSVYTIDIQVFKYQQLKKKRLRMIPKTIKHWNKKRIVIKKIINHQLKFCSSRRWSNILMTSLDNNARDALFKKDRQDRPCSPLPFCNRHPC